MNKTLLVSLLLLSPLALAAEPCGRITFASGTVEILPGGKRLNRFYKDGYKILNCDDVLITGKDGNAVLQLNGAKIAMGKYSRLEIADFDRTRDNPLVKTLNLIHGRIRAWVLKGEDRKFEIRTTSAVSGVRGTDFYMSHDNVTHLTEEATIQGRVEVAAHESKTPAMILAGLQVSVADKAKDPESQPLTDAMIEQIRVTSAPVKDDPDFRSEDAIVFLGNPQGWRNETERWIFSLGYNDGKFVNNSDGFSLHAQYQTPWNDMALIGLVGITSMESKKANQNHIRHDFSALKAEAGLRMWDQRWWSPFVRAGGHYQSVRSNLHNPPLESNGMRDYLSFAATLGVDIQHRPLSWRRIGYYASVESTFTQSLLAGESSGPNSPSSLNGFAIGLHGGLLVTF